MRRHVGQKRTASALLFGLLFVASPLCPTAVAQNSAPTKPTKPTTPNPGALKQAVMPGLPAGTIVRPQMAKEPGPYIKRSNEREWLTKVNIEVSDRDYGVSGSRALSPNTPTIEQALGAFDTFFFYFPVVGLASNASLKRIETSSISLGRDDTFITADLKDDKVTSRNGSPKFQLIKELETRPGTPMPAGAWLTRWAVLEPSTMNRVKFEIRTVTECSNTELDWDAAGKVAWPTSGWPLQAAAALQSQLYIDYITDPKTGNPKPFDFEPMKRLIDRVTSGKPKSVPPLTMARQLAAEIVPKFNLNGDPYKRGPDGNKQIVGFKPQPVDESMRTMRGNELDLSILLVAMYREAGIPARLVVGLQTEEDDNRKKSSNEDKPRAWLEFCLYDEPKNTVTWVPVDPYRMKRRSSAVPALDKPWPYFGDHNEMRNLVPLATQLLPASVNAVSYGDPTLWGWNISPQPPASNFTRMTILSERAPKSSADREEKSGTGPQKPQSPNRP
jgi:transglutaminase-like putative cysteine protease